MKTWFGKIEIGKIENIPIVSTVQEEKGESFKKMNDSHIRFVHYPDSQQLIIWLPQPGLEYENVQLRDAQTGKLAEEWTVADKLSGSVQLLWDTTPIKPGEYTIEINWKNKWKHRIDIVKNKKEVARKKKESPSRVKTENLSSKNNIDAIIYKDGFGNIIPDEDLILREKLKKKLTRNFSRHLEYKGNFRDGSIHYIDGDYSIELNHEMGAGNCMFYIWIPTRQQWASQTKIPLEERDEILDFIAQTVKNQQATSCRFEIKEDTIGFFYK